MIVLGMLAVRPKKMQVPLFHLTTFFSGLFLPLALAGVCLAEAPTPATAPSFKIYVEEDAAYQVGFEELAAAGLETDSLASASLGLTCAGKDVPIHVADGGDGIFGPGDRVEFVGQHLPGEGSYFNEHSRYNVYQLATAAVGAARMMTTAGINARAVEGPATYRSEQHLEEDLLRLRLPAADGEAEELWYWAKMAFNAKEPTTRTVDLRDLARHLGQRTATLRVHLRGWSKPRAKPDPEMADHQVEAVWNGESVATAAWNGTQPYLLEIPGLGREQLLRGENLLQLSIPRRRSKADADALIDVVMLNWIEISYPRDEWIDGAAHLILETPVGRLRSSPGRQLVVLGAGGSRSVAEPGEEPGEALFPVPEGERSFVVVGADAWKTPVAVTYDRPSHLRNGEQQADYIMIAHRTLLEAILPLAELHRSRGLAVEVVDLQDVYDEFNHGIAHPRAIRSFLRFASHSRQPPAPRFVLLVGDASWDARNARAKDWNYADWTYRPWERERFVKNTSYPYAEDAEFNRRGLVPTWSHSTREGTSASDNFFATLSGDDFRPDIAIGRLPVVTAEEVTGIVEKIVRYITAPEGGPWRRNVLLITNESTAFQRQSEKLAHRFEADGFVVDKVYPASREATNEHHSKRLVEAFDAGQLLVHFLGHGGRYIWRTGPPDLKKNHDLFTLEHLDQLAPSGRLPVVLSLTCYSAPFDHPNADSIGEKLLRLDGRGAIAVLAASWRNRPSPRWGQVLVDELTQPGTTVGEAVMRAKHRVESRLLVETYNLLGDPALPIALPAAGAGNTSP